jgi:hypothetical protein
LDHHSKLHWNFFMALVNLLKKLYSEEEERMAQAGVVWRLLYEGRKGTFNWLAFLAASKDVAVAHASAVLAAERLKLDTTQLPVTAEQLQGTLKELEELLWTDADTGKALVGVLKRGEGGEQGVGGVWAGQPGAQVHLVVAWFGSTGWHAQLPDHCECRSGDRHRSGGTYERQTAVVYVAAMLTHVSCTYT